ncbi:MAG: adenine phosphoribosyltransferase [Candidatus Pacebacteria bacterium]|nr:adenine phosphoribosyltransferase [Candidatus Paceibacterota bacterium]
MNLKTYIERAEDFPKPGIVFRDVSPLLSQPDVLAHVVDTIAARWKGSVDVVAALDARGFLFGTPVSCALRLPFVMIRKKGKLPGKTLAHTYALEYGTDTIEMKPSLVPQGARVLVIDDLLATGGTAAAACALIEASGGRVAGCAFVVELDGLNGRSKLAPHDIQSLTVFSDKE